MYTTDLEEMSLAVGRKSGLLLADEDWFAAVDLHK
jgi:hypothetical protein